MTADLENYKVVEEADATKICLLLSRSCKPVHLAQFCHFDPKNVFFLRILSAVPGVHLIDMFPQKNNLFGFYAYHLDTSAHTLGVSIYDVEEDLPRFLKLASTRHLKFIVFRNINEEVDDLLFSLQVVLKLIKWWKKSFKPSESKNSVEVTTSNLRSFQEIFGEMCRCPKNKNSTLCVEASEFKGNKMLVDDFAKIHPSAVGLRFYKCSRLQIVLN
ncbi:hypothetical protein L596_019519 [Steinernema carpocapsae]|uniref:Uncharacterized protein n=1 Tax=Steinernema carpocapsae TaxID=34508 RepID=A0A4U5MRL0_STECR|nr:hypothetical protein L596_019519 [Steinernema carpocapsae]